ncbi:MAG TPA: DUF2169 domain-containing protein [Fibrobacteria bacterium]|nr:DUF2169 domain-containing protein [Fibrobacteria bacterium]
MNTEWFSHFIPGNAPDGKPILSVLGKRTYKFDNGKTAWEDEEEQVPFLEVDEYLGEGNPAVDALRLESDLVAYKPMTDVIFIGKACVPGGQKLPRLDFGIEVGGARKIGRAIGDRKVIVTGTSIVFSEPEPFSEMPLDYTRAYGGRDEKSEPGALYVFPRNQVGKGFVVKNTPAALQGLALPNLEDPARPLTPQNLVLGRFERWKEYPEPVALGCVNKNSYPRYTLAGLPPDAWADAEAERQRGLLKNPEIGIKPSSQPSPVPPMMNLEFFNGASPGLKFPYLAGNEPVRLANLDPKHGRFTFNLPGVRPQCWIDVGEGPKTMDMVLHTVVIYKPTNQLTMVWRGSAGYGGFKAMEKFTNLEHGIKVPAA